jgi:hypothetical protein
MRGTIRSLGKVTDKMAHLQDDGGLILSLFCGPPITEPEATHLGFMQETEEQVNEINRRLKDDGFPARAAPPGAGPVVRSFCMDRIERLARYLWAHSRVASWGRVSRRPAPARGGRRRTHDPLHGP